MNIPSWFKPALTGAVFGAMAMVVVGFSYGGWVTSGTANKNSASNLTSGLALALTPYCVERSKSDPAAAQVLAELKAASMYGRRSIVEKAGWATPLGSDKPDSALASACGEELLKTL